jgi:hypothetical protein
MPGPDLGFDDRNLLAASRDSYHLPFVGDLSESPAVAIELGLLFAQSLPALHNHVHILGVQLEAEANTLGEFRSR